MGEDLDKLEEFRSEGLASRILGMGDVIGLMKDFEDVMDEKQAEQDTKKLLRGEFTLDDFLSQIKMMQQVGSLSEIYEKFPIFGDQLPEGASIDDSMFNVMESMIRSMTPAERNKPQIIDESRAIRIARGSGRKKEQVLDLVQRFGMMHQLMAGIASQPGLLGNLPGLKQLNQLRKLKGMGKNGLQDLLGGMPGMGGGGMPGLPGMPAGGGMPGLPGMPPGGMPAGMPGMPGMGGGMPDLSPQQIAAMRAQMGMGMGAPQKPKKSAASKAKAKTKRKASRNARKKGRK